MPPSVAPIAMQVPLANAGALLGDGERVPTVRLVDLSVVQVLAFAVLRDGIRRERPVPRRGYLPADEGPCSVGGAVAIEPVDAVLVGQEDVQGARAVLDPRCIGADRRRGDGRAGARRRGG